MSKLQDLVELARDGAHDCEELDCVLCNMREIVFELFDESQPCALPEPKPLPGIGKVEIPEDAAGLWDVEDARAFFVLGLKACDDASKGD